MEVAMQTLPRTRATAGRLGLVAVLFFSVAALAQKKEVDIAVKDMKFFYMRSPIYTATPNITNPRAAGQNAEWLQICVEYEIGVKPAKGGDWLASDDYVDELTFDWHVLIKPQGFDFGRRPGRSDPRPVLLRRSATYIDILDDKKPHVAVMYLRPGFMERYGGVSKLKKNDIAVAMDIRVNGLKKDTAYGGDMIRELLKLAKTSRTFQEWWRWEEPLVVRRDDELLYRTETPFAVMDFDGYEFLKPGKRD